MWQRVKNKRKFFIGLGFVILGVFLDRYTKISVLEWFGENTNSVLKVFPGFNIVLVFNKGIAFGIFNNESFIKSMPTVLLFITFFIVCGIIYLFWKENDNIIIFSLLITGGLGNILDRLSFGAVVDFLDFYVGEYHWPAFNLADSCICVGIMLYIIYGEKNKTNQ
ncbi:MAG: signal peptidase II [Rickettsiales bacterium]|jgi:signal peptidase II|nr:signal peptidase II [Rickettsiales bacterium]